MEDLLHKYLCIWGEDGSRHDVPIEVLHAEARKLRDELVNKQILPTTAKREYIEKLEDDLRMLDMIRCYIFYGWKIDKKCDVYKWLRDKMYETLDKLREFEED